MIPDFLYELTRSIVRELDVQKDRPALIALTTTRTLLQSEAKELLYQKMSDKSISTQHYFMSMLGRKAFGPKRAPYMKVYHAFESPYLNMEMVRASTPATRRLNFLKMLTLLENALPTALPKLIHLKELSIPFNPWEENPAKEGLKREIGGAHFRRWVLSKIALFDLIAGEQCTFELESFASRNVRNKEGHYASLAKLLHSQPGLKRLTFLNEMLPINNRVNDNPSRPWIDTKAHSQTASNLIFFRGGLKSMTTFLPLAKGRVEILVLEPPPTVWTGGIMSMSVPRNPDSSVESRFFNLVSSYMGNIKYLTIQSYDWRIPNPRGSLVNLQCLQLETFKYPEDLEYISTLTLKTLIIPHYDAAAIYDTTLASGFDRSPESKYTVDEHIIPQCPNIRYIGDCFSLPDHRSDFHMDNSYRVWDRENMGTGPEKYEISKVALMCHHIFELLPRKYCM